MREIEGTAACELDFFKEFAKLVPLGGLEDFERRWYFSGDLVCPAVGNCDVSMKIQWQNGKVVVGLSVKVSFPWF